MTTLSVILQVFTAQAPAIVVLTPILAGLLVLLAGTKSFGIYSFKIVNLALLVFVAFLLVRFLKDRYPIYYVFGRWNSEVGIEFKMDMFSVFALLLQFTILLFTIHIELQIHASRKHLPYALFLFIESAYSGIILTNDIFNLYVFLEISALASYPLLAIGGSKKSYISAFNYLVIGTIAATLILISVGFMLSLCGSLNLEVVKSYFNHQKYIIEPKSLEVLGLLFLLGAYIKLAIFPLHFWKIESYERSSCLVANFFIAISTVAIMSILFKFRFLAETLSTTSQLLINLWGYLTVIFGALLALREYQYRTSMLYLTVSSVGYYLILWPFDNEDSMHIFFQLIVVDSFVKTALFLIPHLLSRDNFDIRSLIGFAKNHKITSFIILIVLVNAGALPPTLLFFNKIAFIEYIAKFGMLSLSVILVSSLSATLVYLRIIRNMLKTSDIEEDFAISKKAFISIVFLLLCQMLLFFDNDLISVIANSIHLENIY